MWSKLVYTVLLLATLTFSQKQTNDYIWINYQSKMPVMSLNNGTGSANLPCEVKIGSCRIQYNLLPYGWAASANGTILFPIADSKKSGGYLIKANLSDMFGDQIQADLVGIFSNNVLSFTDRSQFFSQNSYNKKNTQQLPLTIPKAVQLKKDVNLQGFPTISQIQNLLNIGNIYTISSKLKDISQKYAPCEDRLSYLNEINRILQNKITENENFINNFEVQKNNFLKNIAILQTKRNDLQKKISLDKNFNDIKNRINNLEALRAQLSSNYTKMDSEANKYLSNMNQVGMKKVPVPQNNTDQIQIKQMQDEVKKLQQTINQAMQKKKELQQQIQKKKSAQAAIRQSQPNLIKNSDELMKNYEQKYREYSNSALQARIRLIGTQQQLKSLNTRYNAINADLNSIDKDITTQKQKMDDKQSPISIKKQQQQMNNNQIFKLSAKNMQNKINLLKNSQCGYF